MFLSHPHFYNADPVLADAVLGLHPDEREHSLFLDVHPVSLPVGLGRGRPLLPPSRGAGWRGAWLSGFESF